MFEGKLIIFSAPSGSGKTTIVKHLLNTNTNLGFSISACNRPRREGVEEHGKDYYFLTTDDFKKRIENNEFAEWEEVYEGSYYGTLISEIDRIWAQNKHVIFDIDVQGALTLKKKFGEKALSVFVKIPSVEELTSRLTNRGTETPAQLEKRLNKVRAELAYESKFDTVLLNDKLDEALVRAQKILSDFLNQ